jgi:hypothetical protein
MNRLRILALILCIVSVAVTTLAIWHFWPRSHEQTKPTDTIEDSISIDTLQVHEPNRYQNALFGFSLEHPPDIPLAYQIYEGDALTVVFQQKLGAAGFQIHVAPYTDEQISRERFLADIPSGVVAETEEIQIDSTKALLFTSVNSEIGKTREAWFIYKGRLYQITTYRELDPLLRELIKKWKFI